MSVKSENYFLSIFYDLCLKCKSILKCYNSKVKMPIYFDVGANDGSSMIQYTSSKNNLVFAFEPTPYVVNYLMKMYGNISNYIIIPKAVSNYEGMETFYISGQADWGCSSLCKFNDNLEQTWPGRTDFKVTEQIQVPVIRLDNFIKYHNIPEIEYLHVDVQGCDLEVLMGLGEYIHIVKAGVIEMPMSHETKLYKNQKYIAYDAIQFLVKHGFKIQSIIPNDPEVNEVNIHFQHK